MFLQICNLTQIEVDYYDICCNFTPEEETIFHMRAKGLTIEECAEKTDRSIDSVKKLSAKIKAKMSRV